MSLDVTVGSPIYLGSQLGNQVAQPVQLGVTTVNTNPAVEKYKEHIQTTPAATWTIDHDFGRYPSVTIIDDATKSVVLTDIEYTSISRVTITWARNTTGRVILL